MTWGSKVEKVVYVKVRFTIICYFAVWYDLSIQCRKYHIHSTIGMVFFVLNPFNACFYLNTCSKPLRHLMKQRKRAN